VSKTLLDPDRRRWSLKSLPSLGVPRSLRTYLVLFATALAVPLLILAGVSLNRMAALEQDQLELRIRLVSNDLSRMVDRELDHTIAILETLATSRGLASGNLSVFGEWALQALHNSRSTIFLLDRSFNQIINTRASKEAPLPPADDVETPKRVLESLSPHVSGVVVDAMTRRPVVHIEVPVIEESEVRYFLGMAIETSFFADVLRAHRPDPLWITGITDQDGVIVARSAQHDEFSGKQLPRELFRQSLREKGAFRGVSAAGEPIVRVTSRSRHAGWLISATVPQWYADAAQRGWHLWLVILTLAAVILGGVLAYFFAELIERPLAQATQAAEDLGKGAILEARPSALIEANSLTHALSAASKELAARADQASVLTHEVTHRSKNLLAVVIALTSQIARQSSSVEEFREGLSSRLHALARSKDLLVKGDWKGADLADLVRAQIAPFIDANSSRLVVEGPPLLLHADTVRNIGLALHELGTNASKYGALATPDGTMAVRWRLTGRESGTDLELSWEEHGGSPAQMPERKGFGHFVLTGIVPQALGGSASLEFHEKGLRWWLHAPVRRLIAEDGK